jgi:hypothetical protein
VLRRPNLDLTVFGQVCLFHTDHCGQICGKYIGHAISEALRLGSRVANPQQAADDSRESYVSFAFDESVLVINAIILS